MNESDRQEALRVLREAMRDSDARPADRVRAAQLMLEHDSARPGANGALHDATDQELLRIARGNAPRGDSPPLMGPAGNSAVAVPSDARKEPRATPTAPTAGGVELAEPAGPDALGRTPGVFLRRGPKEDPPPKAPTPRPVSQRGPKTDPQKAKMDLPVSVQFDSPPRNGETPALEPWE
jgi:hypothetical protein